MRKIPDKRDAHRCRAPLPPFDPPVSPLIKGGIIGELDEVRVSFPVVLISQFKSFITI